MAVLIAEDRQEHADGALVVGAQGVLQHVRRLGHPVHRGRHAQLGALAGLEVVERHHGPRRVGPSGTREQVGDGHAATLTARGERDPHLDVDLQAVRSGPDPQALGDASGLEQGGRTVAERRDVKGAALGTGDGDEVLVGCGELPDPLSRVVAGGGEARGPALGQNGLDRVAGTEAEKVLVLRSHEVARPGAGSRPAVADPVTWQPADESCRPAWASRRSLNENDWAASDHMRGLAR